MASLPRWDPEHYSRHSSAQERWASEILAKLDLNGGEQTLDIGCGDGKITAELARCLPQGRAVGVDSSEKMIELAKTAFPQKDYPNLCFKVMDARKLTFQSEFDLAFSNAALHWIVDQKAVLEGVQRSLKPGGRLLFQMAGKGNAKAILDIIYELLDMEAWTGYFRKMAFPYGFYDSEEYKGFLKQVGLEPERVELFPKDMKFNGAEGLAGWIRTTWLPFTDKLPTELKPKFVEQIVNRYLNDNPPDADSTVHVGMMRIEAEAYKP